MTLYTLKYTWREHEGSLDIDREGIFYLDLSEPKVMAYANPTDSLSAILAVTKKKIFLVHENRSFELGPAVISSGGLAVSVERKESLGFDPKKYLEPALELARRHGKAYARKPAVLGGLVFFLIVVILVSFFSSEDTEVSSQLAMELEEMAPDIPAEELKKRRLALAEYYLREKNYTLSIDLADKVLAVTPDHPEAMAIKEKGVAFQDKAKTEAQRILKEELRVKALLDNASSMMAQGDFLGASLVIEQVLEGSPKHAEAHRMQSEIRAELDRINEKKKASATSDQQRSLEAERLWQDGRALYESQKYAEAWARLREAQEIVQGLAIQPAFRIDLKELLSETELQLSTLVRPLIEKGRRERNEGDAATGISQIRSYQEALASYFEAESVFASYPLLRDEITLTLKNLNEAVSPFFVEAETIMGLEGCCAAGSYLDKVVSLAKFDRVPHFVKAKQLREQCPCE